MREEVHRLVSLGTLPTETASVSAVAERQALIQSISRPVDLDEAKALAQILGGTIALVWRGASFTSSKPRLAGALSMFLWVLVHSNLLYGGES